MIRHALILGAALGLAREPSCGGVDSPTAGVNAPCTRQKDCSEGLVCVGGVCAEPDAGANDAGAKDAADGGG